MPVVAIDANEEKVFDDHMPIPDRRLAGIGVGRFPGGMLILHAQGQWVTTQPDVSSGMGEGSVTDPVLDQRQ